MLEKYNVEVEYVSVGRWTETDDIANLLAAGEAPDVSYTYGYNTIISYANMKDANGNPGVIDLAPYLEEYKDYTQNILTLLGGEENLYYDKDPPPVSPPSSARTGATSWAWPCPPPRKSSTTAWLPSVTTRKPCWARTRTR